MWTTDDLENREMEEIISGGFGLGKVVEDEEGPSTRFNTIEEQTTSIEAKFDEMDNFEFVPTSFSAHGPFNTTMLASSGHSLLDLDLVTREPAILDKMTGFFTLLLLDIACVSPIPSSHTASKAVVSGSFIPLVSCLEPLDLEYGKKFERLFEIVLDAKNSMEEIVSDCMAKFPNENRTTEFIKRMKDLFTEDDNEDDFGAKLYRDANVLEEGGSGDVGNQDNLNEGGDDDRNDVHDVKGKKILSELDEERGV
ncbi:hypothetical protein L2E82_51661 [Cichorium intybus]|nr:hypothetical protein L2E82_51661 [Cichorium intybus]